MVAGGAGVVAGAEVVVAPNILEKTHTRGLIPLLHFVGNYYTYYSITAKTRIEGITLRKCTMFHHLF